jgi:hypothetical protein
MLFAKVFYRKWHEDNKRQNIDFLVQDMLHCVANILDRLSHPDELVTTRGHYI